LNVRSVSFAGSGLESFRGDDDALRLRLSPPPPPEREREEEDETTKKRRRRKEEDECRMTE
jgi:hypothetical protein